MTNNVLSNRHYTPNRALKSLINDFISRQQTSSGALAQEFLAFKICGQQLNSDWKHRPRIKIQLTLLGSSGAGKSILAQCLQYGHWPKGMAFPSATIGNDIIFYYLDTLFRNEYVVVIQLNDPPGQEKFEAVTNQFFRQCHGALLLIDMTDLNSFDRLEKYWYSRLEDLGMDHVQSVLVCTKMDLFETKDNNYRELFLKRAQQFAFVHQMPIVHISAYRGDNVEYLFKQLIIRIMENDALINDLIAHANAPDNLIIQRRQTSVSQNSNSLELSVRHEPHQQTRKKKWTCCN
jgi:small GTP-binding protein